MVPVISIVGRADTGKTTLMEKLIGELKGRGYRIATVKHAPQGASIDEPGKDSWRHLQAGSQAAAVVSKDSVVLIKPTRAPKLDDIMPLFGEDYDIVLAEGFKGGDAPKIEVHRKDAGPPLGDISKLFAIVSDEPLENEVRQFSPQDIKGLADLVEQGFLDTAKDRLSLYVNKAPVSMSGFPREVVANIMLALASSLKGVGKINTLHISFRRGSRK